MRRPFDWIVPRCLGPDEDTLGPLIDFFNTLVEANGKASFLVPDITLRREGRPGVFDDEAQWVFERPMAYGKFVDLAQGLLLSLGMERTEVLGVTYNTFRRSLPSIGEAVAYSTEEAQSLSNWTEVIRGANAEPGPKMRAAHPTSRNYAAGKFYSAAINRHKAVIIVHMAATAMGIKAEHVKSNSIPWSVVRQLCGQVEPAEQLAVRGPPWALPSKKGGAEPILDLSKLDDADTDKPKVTSDSSSSSSSSGSDQAEGADNGSDEDPGDDEVPLPFRAREGGKIHLQHFFDDSGVVPYCRDKPLINFLREAPHWLEIDISEICQECTGRLPEAVAQKLRRSCGRNE